MISAMKIELDVELHLKSSQVCSGDRLESDFYQQLLAVEQVMGYSS
jgi:hypothetical protein